MVRNFSSFSLVFHLRKWHTGLIGHIKTHFPPMYRLFKALKNRLAPLTNEELLIAAGKKILDQDATSEFLKKLERSSKTVIQVFNEQNLKAAVSCITSNPGFPFILVISQRIKHGTRKGLKPCSPSGWWYAISLSKKLIDPSSESYSNTHTFVRPFEYHIVAPSVIVL
jgi:hypothetical protein